MINVDQKMQAWNALYKTAIALLLLGLSGIVNAQSGFQLTDEQLSLLHDQPYVPAENIESLNRDYPIPLISFTVSAARQTTNTDQFSIVAVYQSLGVNLREKSYLVDAPSISGLDFSDAIKKKCAESPKTFLGDMIVDGALGFNFNW